MPNFGVLLEIGRWNLGGPPRCPALSVDEVLIYRTGQLPVRMAVFQVSDVLLATLGAGTTTNQALVCGDLDFVGAEAYYYTAECRSLAPPLTYWVNAVKISDGSVTSKNINPAPSVWYQGVVRALGGAMGTVTSGDIFAAAPAPVGVRSIQETPPFAGAGTDVGGDIGLINPPVVGDKERTGFQQSFQPISRFPTDATGNYLRLVPRLTGAPDVRRSIPPYTYHDVRDILPSPEGPGLPFGPINQTDGIGGVQGMGYNQYMGMPWYWLEDDFDFYAFSWRTDGVVAANNLFCYQKIPKSGWNGVGNFYLFPLATWGQFIGAGQPDNLPSPAASPPRCYDAFAQARGFGFIYWTVGARANRWIHKSRTWPIDVYDPYSVDTTGLNGEITGIWVYPPFIYVTKTGGAQGDQLIKFFDPDLDQTPTGARHSGSELWALIPELKDYLG